MKSLWLLALIVVVAAAFSADDADSDVLGDPEDDEAGRPVPPQAEIEEEESGPTVVGNHDEFKAILGILDKLEKRLDSEHKTSQNAVSKSKLSRDEAVNNYNRMKAAVDAKGTDYLREKELIELIRGMVKGGGNFPGSNLLSLSQQKQVLGWYTGPYKGPWKLCYSKKKNGGNSQTFHGLCDNKGESIVVYSNNQGSKWGGYTPVPWTTAAAYRKYDSGFPRKPFMFSLTHSKKLDGPIRNYAIYNNKGYGPTFGGGHDTYVNGAMTGGYCNLGHDYACGTSSYGSTACRNWLCGCYSCWTLVDVEVWIH